MGTKVRLLGKIIWLLSKNILAAKAKYFFGLCPFVFRIYIVYFI